MTNDQSRKEKRMEEALEKRSENEEDLLDPEDIDVDDSDIEVGVKGNKNGDSGE